MKILYVITGLNYGGAETQLVKTVLHLRTFGEDVQVVSLTPPLAYTEKLKEAGVPVISLGIQRKTPDFRPLFRLVRLINQWKPDIVHAHMVHANLLVRIARPLSSIPVLICTAHNVSERGRRGSGKLRELAYRLTDPFCDLTLQVSQAGVERYVKIRAVPRHKIRYFPNGVDLDEFKPDPEARARLRRVMRLEGLFVWLAVGRFDPQKDYFTMIQAFRTVQGEQPASRLLIVGEGPLRLAMEKIATEFGLKEKMIFLGIRRDIPDIMNAADAYVMSSAWEGLPNVLLEAHATGLPAVATDVGGNREILKDGITGFIVPPKSPEALAQAMLRLMNLSQEERQRMGEAARRHVEMNFDLKKRVNNLRILYQELLARKRVSGNALMG
jgi:glycosyltransferase involved in cell wall biosynthesis